MKIVRASLSLLVTWIASCLGSLGCSAAAHEPRPVQILLTCMCAHSNCSAYNVAGGQALAQMLKGDMIQSEDPTDDKQVMMRDTYAIEID